MNKFVRFLLHTAIVVVLFILLGVFGSEIDNDAGGSVSTVSIFALLGIPFFIVLQLAFDTLEDVDNIVVSFLRGALVFIGVIGAALSFLIQQGVFAGEDAGTISNIFLASIVAAFPFSMITAVYFYFGLQFTEAKWKALIAPVSGYLVSFVVNLICTLLGKYVAPFFYGWFLFALVGVLIVVLIIVLIKCGSDWTEKIYPSDHTPTATSSNVDASYLIVMLNAIKNNPEKYITNASYITFHTPWRYDLNVSNKKIYFTGSFTMKNVDKSAAANKINEIVEDLVKEALKLAAEGNSYFNPYTWSVSANMTAYN